MLFLQQTIFIILSLTKVTLIKCHTKFITNLKPTILTLTYLDAKFFSSFPRPYVINLKIILYQEFFLGYSDNPSAYKILDIFNNKIVFSIIVEFFEHTPGNFFLNKYSHDFNYFIPSHEIRGNNSYFLNDSYNSYYNNHLPLNNNKYHSQNSTTLKYYKDIQDNQIKRPNKTKKKKKIIIIMTTTIIIIITTTTTTTTIIIIMIIITNITIIMIIITKI